MISTAPKRAFNQSARYVTALCLAIDREALINNVAQVEAQPAYSFLAPGYVVDGKDITEGRSDYGLSSTADVEGAKAALEEAGYPNGEVFRPYSFLSILMTM